MSISPLDEQASVRMRQRLWGAAVLIAIAVIFLPLLLDGSGSESQFRRVESLREEPPRIVGGDAGTSSDTTLSQVAARVSPPPADTVKVVFEDKTAVRPAPDIRIGENDPPDYLRDDSSQDLSSVAPRRRDATAPPTAWVVQAGSFRERGNAVAVRDQLRRAGYPSFVAEVATTASGKVVAGSASAGSGTGSGAGDAQLATSVFRVQVGPMIDEASAAATRQKVEQLLGRPSLVLNYP